MEHVLATNGSDDDDDDDDGDASSGRKQLQDEDGSPLGLEWVSYGEIYKEYFHAKKREAQIYNEDHLEGMYMNQHHNVQYPHPATRYMPHSKLFLLLFRIKTPPLNY